MDTAETESIKKMCVCVSYTTRVKSMFYVRTV